MYSTHCDYDYPIDVFVPNVEAPDNGFPVLFVLDGHRYCDMIFSTMNNQIRMSMKTKVDPFIIVSIGHTDKTDTINRRFYDFTAPSAHYTFPLRRGKQMEPVPVGGGFAFKNFIKEELMPHIASSYPADAEQFHLYGHSLGGLFSLWVYLTDPKMFAKYIAVSPSIWWNDHELLTLLQGTPKDDLPPLAIYVGGEEGDMVDDALTFYNNHRCKNKSMVFDIAMHENHASVIPTTISRVMRFL